LQKKIDSLIIKTVLVAEPTLVHQYSLSQANTNLAECCFQILGFDILINQDFNPVLLEVNHTPSLITDTPLDHFIKRSLIKDTFRLLNVNVKSKREKVEKQK
jgi:tubulin polyglutamylase TTLL6/13